MKIINQFDLKVFLVLAFLVVDFSGTRAVAQNIEITPLANTNLAGSE